MARYGNGVLRDITLNSSIAFSYKGSPISAHPPVGDSGIGLTPKKALNLNYYIGALRGGDYNDLFIFYRGQKFSHKVFVEPYSYVGWFMDYRKRFNAKIIKKISNNEISIYTNIMMKI
jgi:hypothetical protein